MSDEKKEGAQDPNLEGQKSLENEQDINIGDDELKSMETVLEEDAFKKIQSLSAQKKHWREKHDKVFSELTALKTEAKKQTETKTETKKEEPKQDDVLIGKIARLELKEYARDKGLTLDKEDIETVFSLAKGFGKDPSDVLGHPIFSAYLTNKDQNKKDDDANISSTGRTVPKQSGKKEYSMEELVEMRKKNPEKYDKLMREKYGR